MRDQHLAQGDDVPGLLELELLGPSRVVWEGHALTIGPHRARALLAVLAFTPGEVVSTDFLIDELLADGNSKNPKNALQASMHRLRTTLDDNGIPGAPLVRTSVGGYLLALPRAAVDTHRFEELAARGSVLVREDPRAAIPLLEQALRLWRGQALADVAGGRRCESQAVRLEGLRLGALEDLYEARLAVRTDRSTVAELEQLAIEHPGRERISALLMIALYRSGRQGEALATFQRVRTWLNRELGLEPGSTMRGLQRAILVQDPMLDGRPVEVHSG
ncbi:AfsR/SARP family transcriptional regulator [Streptomyces olivaceus]|uniref:AfsR/SARP family transcriptional regulator n=1 Tax=Streptomyces TaxID=1883 RepID=UPI001CCF813D|nr:MULTISPECIES: AfsR/SARP family transcriptional regulator [Streptomyces]MBZ6172321.1 AfsR/SARP family transcriptional regulator [Streptomyces olivaceus]MBZ6178832.1 AfsR/SARP family transcriptional regulator [Streptomyces olivaceus]MBZ6254915.1 AfsR/SARP family transcriptional regulator [Streptomyces olivaceus]MCM8549044.1 AfsR/SARP family transcriptional regulator [Streptomyces sp. STCH 565 A]WFB86102.1 AfsR/SARP family transcriptional regulator [Streptomyces olivaceus]